MEPVFLKARDIPDFKTLKEYELCEAICKVIQKERLVGVQRIGMLWRIYIKSKEARVTLLANKIELRDLTINVFENNPFRANIGEGESEQNILKITVKDLPLSKTNKGLEDYLISQGLTLKSKIEYVKARDENNQLTDWLNGDRCVFVERFSDPLPRKTWIGDSSVRIFYKDQPANQQKRCTNCHKDGHYKKECTSDPCCIVCKDTSHRPGDKTCNGTAKQKHKHVTVFAGRQDILSNFHMCEVRIHGMVS